MQQVLFLTLFVFFLLLIDKYLCQKGFPQQFQATIFVKGVSPVQPQLQGVQYLLYDSVKLRVRVDVQGLRLKQNETYMIKYKPEGAEADSPASQDYVMFNFNPDYPTITKNNCWYRTNPISDIGPFPMSWFNYERTHYEIKTWFQLPPNMIQKGEEWIEELQINATRYDSSEICDLRQSGIGKVPCLSYFETSNQPVKTIEAHIGREHIVKDEYTSKIYLSFIDFIPSESEYLFNLPNQWPSYCGNANAGFRITPIRPFVVTPNGEDYLTISIESPPVHGLGDQIKVEFQLQPSYYYNGTRCTNFNPIIFDRKTWQYPQQVNMSFDTYGCCQYAIRGNGGGYEWQYENSTITVYACDGYAGTACKGKYPYFDDKQYVIIEWQLQQHGSFSSGGRSRDISLTQFSSTEQLKFYLSDYIKKYNQQVNIFDKEYTIVDLCQISIDQSNKLLVENSNEISRVTSRHVWPLNHKLFMGCCIDAHIVSTCYDEYTLNEQKQLEEQYDDNTNYCLITQLGNHPTHVKFVHGTHCLRDEILQRFKQPF
ncbi:hypothetical protein I4U23_016207 [Adineta vaga]|nr:hypothetical protein I4U23_016207 [Adineta vaga]